jgi:hypothetical protein
MDLRPRPVRHDLHPVVARHCRAIPFCLPWPFTSVAIIPKRKLKVVVDDQDVETVTDLICDVAQTGEAGDGKIFVYPAEDVIRVRTKERGCTAV